MSSIYWGCTSEYRMDHNFERTWVQHISICILILHGQIPIVQVLHQLGGILVETSNKRASKNARTKYHQQVITQRKRRRNKDQKGPHGTGSYQLTSPTRRWPATMAAGAARLVRIAFKEKNKNFVTKELFRNLKISRISQIFDLAKRDYIDETKGQTTDSNQKAKREEEH
jgi:hypothetical protein